MALAIPIAHRVLRCCSVATFSTSLQPLRLTATKIVVGKQDLNIIQPTDVDEVIDMYIHQDTRSGLYKIQKSDSFATYFLSSRHLHADKLDRDPYWCQIWPSAIALSEEILQNPQLVEGFNICDLGCGLGLGGLTAALSGAKQVVFYDREPYALICSLLSCHANILGVDTYLRSVLNKLLLEYVPSSMSDPWSTLLNSIDKNQLSGNQRQHYRSSAEIKAELFDWTAKGTSMQCHDVVIACDVLYERSSVPFVVDIVGKLLQRTGTKFLLADPVERTPENRELFIDLLKNEFSGQKNVVMRRQERVVEMDGKLTRVEITYMEA